MASPVLDLLAFVILFGLAGAFAAQRFLGRPYWSRIWRRVSQRYDPLRRHHWALPAGDGVMVVFDYKDDYQTFFDELGVDYIRLSLEGSTHIPNVFGEFEDELDVDEFARAMFPDGGGRRDGGSAEHFEDVARQTFAAIRRCCAANGTI
jgi:hypothetical protein